ncbi:hypothetical protein DC433_14925 [Priestia megaterium]|nr:hypothetical protein DC433_14925 [Priestia megaterium]
MLLFTSTPFYKECNMSRCEFPLNFSQYKPFNHQLEAATYMKPTFTITTKKPEPSIRLIVRI